MDPFTCSRGDDPATAAAAHAQDPQLAFIAGGTDLSGLIQDRAAHPNRLLDINGVPDSAHINALPEERRHPASARHRGHRSRQGASL